MGGGSFGALAFGHYSSGGSQPAAITVTAGYVVRVPPSDPTISVPAGD